MTVCRRIRLKVLNLFAGRRRIETPQSGLRAYVSHAINIILQYCTNSYGIETE